MSNGQVAAIINNDYNDYNNNNTNSFIAHKLIKEGR